MTNTYTSHSMVASLKRVMVKRPEAAFISDTQIDTQWEPLAYLGRPNLAKAIEEHRRFTALLESAGAAVEYLPPDARTGMDSIYTHDPVASVTDKGVILARMGKDARMGEPDAIADAFEASGVPILGRIEPPGMVEGGDVVWLDRETVTIGITYRTNVEGIQQFRDLAAPMGIDVIEVPLVHWDGPDAVLHLMSIISMLDDDLAIVFDRLLPIPFRQLLIDKGLRLLPLPENEYDSLGCNVLAVGPRHCLIRSGNPTTERLMREAGCRVEAFDGDEICFKGSGGPTCLTRPVWRG